MPSGDFNVTLTWLGQQFKDQAGDLYDQISENDKQTLSVILKDAVRVTGSAVGGNPDRYHRELVHVKAQFANLAAAYADQVRERVFKILGESLIDMGQGMLKGALS